MRSPPTAKSGLLTKGWLKGSHRELDLKKSKPWEPIHKHTNPQPLKPGEIYEFDIKLVPTANLFKAGSRIAVRIRCVDDAPTNPLELVGHRVAQSHRRCARDRLPQRGPAVVSAAADDQRQRAEHLLLRRAIPEAGKLIEPLCGKKAAPEFKHRRRFYQLKR